MEEQMDTTEGLCFESLPTEIKQLIFSYCGKETRQKITLVSKSWTEAVSYFPEMHVYLHHCYLQKNLEPVSLFMNSIRRCHSLCLGPEIYTATAEVQYRFFSYLGSKVQVLDISSVDVKYLDDWKFLVYFPKLKKLTVRKLDDLRAFRWFPEMLEHVHVKELSNTEETIHFEVLRKIKNLKKLTSDTIFMDYYVRNISRLTRTCTLNLSALSFFSRHFLKNLCLKSNKNLLDAPELTFDDVLEIDGQGVPIAFNSFRIFPNLRSIRISVNASYAPNRDPSCFNFHQAVVCAGVAEFELTDNRQNCIECFKSIIDCFPNVKKVGLNNCSLTNEHVKYVLLKLPNLIHLETDSENLNHEIIGLDQPNQQLESLILPIFTANNMLIHWPPMPHLKKVRFRVLRDDCDLTNLTEKTPNLEFFEVGFGTVLSDTAIEIIAKNWPNLRTLRLHSTRPCDASPIKRFCRNLRELEFNWYFDPAPTYASFFDAIPTLKEISLKEGGKQYRYLKERVGWD